MAKGCCRRCRSLAHFTYFNSNSTLFSFNQTEKQQATQGTFDVVCNIYILFQRVSLFIYFTSFPFHKTLTPLLLLLLQQLGAVLRKNTNHLLLNKCIFSHVGFTFIFIITTQHTTVHVVNSGKEFPFPSFLSKQTWYTVYLFFVGLWFVEYNMKLSL